MKNPAGHFTGCRECGELDGAPAQRRRRAVAGEPGAEGAGETKTGRQPRGRAVQLGRGVARLDLKIKP